MIEIGTQIQTERNGPPLKKCVFISMSTIEKVFHYEENKLSVIKFKAKQVALLLGYLDPEDRISLEKLIRKGGRAKSAFPLVLNFQGSI